MGFARGFARANSFERAVVFLPTACYYSKISVPSIGRNNN
ncbi:hypothetical protein HMPREF0860_2249 [Treponema socranskii subsp. socranskii VPI DR56BR1116 = ATCC 35536]|uniref:Uncharacterized protein n=1 Tax=Treponema socranskii subsp. socranskii VPI DR56BR1116 = ATCC 35536 TaxID=1125725 RepID=U2MVF0_TRESO|nr:hypothetical protein HMPREF1325_1046 [Treponema socranskii subsp. socranskii VPI DR56BR1116 = ATCC 35536]ERK03179.1 hypothetical protein HMPREF0860_2249 [Treponema socranskii subsp. socranskii VPI DR56BR1116 = ATCC 35536]